MTTWLDGIATWLSSLGVHPVLGAFVAGLLIALVLRARRPASEVAPTAGAFAAAADALRQTQGSRAAADIPTPLEPTVLAAVAEIVRQGNLIEAIKLVREKTGLGLTESKQLVDAVAKSARSH